MNVFSVSMFAGRYGLSICGVALLLGISSATAAQTNAISFNRDIRPILSDNCFLCHGPDKSTRKAKLRLDLRETAIEAGAIVPGKPDESKLVQRIHASDPDDLMPPPETHKKLKAEQKEALKQWIASGAEYEPHWAYIAPKRSTPPPFKNSKWVKNPIDTFILHTLEERRIEPSPEADKRRLLRRLSLDLTGLPPTLEEMNGFLKDKTPKAYERQVDRLLASPHFGERMAAPWLDAVRFADTVGYHGDQNQNIFPYRDYVIQSFNKNKPFDQFTIEQLAGDLLPNPTTEQRIATGFNRLNMMTREGGAQPKEYLAKYAADRVRTVSGAWLGSTMGCAECHDHKYDPFATKDFYQMGAFFADLKQWGVYADYRYTPNADLKKFGNEHPFPPEIEVESPYLKNRERQVIEKLGVAHQKLQAELNRSKEEKAAFESWGQNAREFLNEHPTGWRTLHPSATRYGGKESTNILVDAEGVITFTGKAAETEITVPLPQGRTAALRVELLPTETHRGSIIRAAEKTMEEEDQTKPENTIVRFTAVLKPSAATNESTLSFFHAEADYKDDRYAMGLPVIGVKDGWLTSASNYKVSQSAVWLLEAPLQLTNDHTLTLKFRPNTVGCMRISVTPFGSPDPLQAGNGDALAKSLAKSNFGRSKVEREKLAETYTWSTGWNPSAMEKLKKLHAELWECRGGRAFTMVSEAREPIAMRVLPRGNWQDESGEVVQPAPPHFLPQLAGTNERRLTRLDLARWLVSRDNPLTARTFVNRLWKQFYGTGISGVVDDLGAQGEWPTHPELLDWLAVEFMESGWDIKHIVKLMVTSSAYRQDSRQRIEVTETDPANRLLSFHSPRRLDAEFVRDNALFISGLLNLEVGGPSARPYQPAGYYANLQFPDRDYNPHNDDRQYRRGIYTHWQRTFLHPMLANFDAPSREEGVCARNLSNTPQQALTLLNDPSFFEASRVLAERVLEAKVETDAQRLDLIYQRALARSVNSRERESLLQFLAQQREHYASHPDEAEKQLKVGLAPARQNDNRNELAAWASVCRVVLNLHETITLY